MGQRHQINPNESNAPWHTLDAYEWRERVVECTDSGGPDSSDADGNRTGGGAVQGIRAALYRISRYDRQLNAFATVLAEEALVTAHQLDQLAPQDRGPLHGVPVAIKEEMHVAGVVTTFGTRANTIPAAQDSQVVSRLRDAGAVIIGTTRMPEFGAWPFTESVCQALV